MYQPPFNVTPEIVNLIAMISAQIERYAIRLEQSDGLHLRKANRIRTIHSSLAIEGNNLSEEQVHDIINGKNVVAPIKEIQEVKNAIHAYEELPSLNPFDEGDLLKAHREMMYALADDAGNYRSRGVGVFSESGLVHMAPSADRVPILMRELFAWLCNADDHLLLRSCVFHYEFEFIHPFSDGNGRIGRFWQSLILGQLHPLFFYLPVENMVYRNQQEYYDAIAVSSEAGESTQFISFMLREILKTLKEHQGAERNALHYKLHYKLHDKYPDIPDMAWRLLDLIAENPRLTASEIAIRLGIGERMIRNHFATLKRMGLIERQGSNKTGFWKVIDV